VSKVIEHVTKPEHVSLALAHRLPRFPAVIVSMDGGHNGKRDAKGAAAACRFSLSAAGTRRKKFWRRDGVRQRRQAGWGNLQFFTDSFVILAA
jgi:hypothetical protein